MANFEYIIKKIKLRQYAHLLPICVVAAFCIVIVCVFLVFHEPVAQEVNNFYVLYPRISEELNRMAGSVLTCQYAFSDKNWENWKLPVLDVTFKYNFSGEISITQCKAYILQNENTAVPRFIITDPIIKINKHQIDVTLLGYLDYGRYQSEVKTFSYKVHFLQEPHREDIFSHKATSQPIVS